MAVIDDLDANSPANSDDVSGGAAQIRDTKAAVQGSFPSLGANPVTKTATEINQSVTTVFGRPGPTITAAEGDYKLDELEDVTLSGQNDGQQLIRRSGTWINDRIAYENGQYNTWNGKGLGNRIRLSNEVRNGDLSGSAFISPNAGDGFFIRASATCIGTVNFSVFGNATPSGGNPTVLEVAIGRNGDNDWPLGGNLLATGASTWVNDAADFAVHCSANFRLVDGDEIYLYWRTQGTGGGLFVSDASVMTYLRER